MNRFAVHPGLQKLGFQLLKQALRSGGKMVNHGVNNRSRQVSFFWNGRIRIWVNSCDSNGEFKSQKRCKMKKTATRDGFLFYRVERSKSEISLDPAVKPATVALLHHFVEACIFHGLVFAFFGFVAFRKLLWTQVMICQ